MLWVNSKCGFPYIAVSLLPSSLFPIRQQPEFDISPEVEESSFSYQIYFFFLNLSPCCGFDCLVLGMIEKWFFSRHIIYHFFSALVKKQKQKNPKQQQVDIDYFLQKMGIAIRILTFSGRPVLTVWQSWVEDDLDITTRACLSKAIPPVRQ